MAVLLVRHAVAQPRTRWAGDDQARPLNERGRRQADALVGAVAQFRITRVLSSPTVRCVDTVAPLAGALELKVEESEPLAEGCGDEAPSLLGELLDEAGDGDGGDVVLSTHGDVIADLLDRLEEEGSRLDDDRCQKGSVWVLERDGKGRLSGRYLPPPG
ncbi:MAG: SixA phosphatase family protein [Acidimicrobiales bacterium]